MHGITGAGESGRVEWDGKDGLYSPGPRIACRKIAPSARNRTSGTLGRNSILTGKDHKHAIGETLLSAPRCIGNSSSRVETGKIHSGPCVGSTVPVETVERDPRLCHVRACTFPPLTAASTSALHPEACRQSPLPGTSVFRIRSDDYNLSPLVEHGPK